MSLDMPERAWVGVVSADHAAIAVAEGWIQLNHGKKTNLARLRQGDGFVIYSPTLRYKEGPPLRAFTALGIVADEEPYLAEEMMTMTDRAPVQPWRRRVDFQPTQPVAVGTLKGRLELTHDRNWGYALRFGLVPLSPADFILLRDVMVT